MKKSPAFRFETALGAGLWALFFSTAAFAQTSQNIYGAAGQTNSLDYASYSARTVVWGPAFTGVADDASALLSNPAGLAFLVRGQGALHSYLGLMDAVGETAVLGLPLGDGGGAGLAVNYLNYGSFEGRDSAGFLAPNYGADRLGLQAGWGRNIFPEMSLGLAVHYSQQDLPGMASSFWAADMGLLWKPVKEWKIGLDYLPPGLVSPSDASVASFKAGASWQAELDPSARLLTAVGNSLQSNGLDYLQAGVEASYRSTYFLRGGYRFAFNDNGAGGFSGLSFGAGLALADFALDYAYTPSAWVSDSNRFSLTYFWGGPKVEQVSTRGDSGPEAVPLSSPKGKNGIPPTSTNVPSSSPAGVSVSSPAPVTVFAQPPKLDDNAAPTENSKRLTLQFDIPADYTSQAKQLQAQGQLSEAVSLYQQALQQDPRDLHAWWGLGNTYFKQGKKTDAVACFEKVLELKPDDKGLANWLEKYKARQP